MQSDVLPDSRLQDLQKDVQAFLFRGGFVYFDTFHNVVGVNMIQDPKIQSSFMIHFGPYGSI